MATVVPTATVTVNAAFLQEIKEVNAELWQLLDNLRALSGSLNDVREHAAQYVDMLIELRDQIALHFALEEAYGYFDDPAIVLPALSDQADRLRAEHRHLYLRMDQLAEESEELLFAGEIDQLVPSATSAFWEFNRRLMEHEAIENDMILRQFEDMGVGD